MVENGHANGLAFDWPVVIAPGRTFAPGAVILIAFAVEDMALGDLAFDPHRRGQANRHRSFLRIAQDDLAF